ncbi:MAG TPA: TetR/AcrR family transcriptional regulator [Devosia sp.]|nr:TetR/AcrR family transcriptional regulator [Devosia sp.]
MIEAATPQSRRESTDDRRAAIARAARQLIVEKGVEGLRTRDIADRVGINIATLHYHVPSKEALIELVAESLHQFFRGQALARPRAHLSAKERMDLEFVDFREAALERPEIILVFSELMERARRDERIAEAIMPLKRSWRQMLVEMLTEGVRDGDYREDLDPEAFATVLMSTMIGFCRNRHKDPGSYERLVAELQRAIRNPNREATRQARTEIRTERRAQRPSRSK